MGILGLLTNDNCLQLSQLSCVWPQGFYSFLSQSPTFPSGDMLGCPAQKWTILLSWILHSSFQNPNFRDVTKHSLLLWQWPASCRMSCCAHRSLIASLIWISSQRSVCSSAHSKTSISKSLITVSNINQYTDGLSTLLLSICFFLYMFHLCNS